MVLIIELPLIEGVPFGTACSMNFGETNLRFSALSLVNKINPKMIVGGKYVPPHMRNNTGATTSAMKKPSLSPFAAWTKNENSKPKKTKKEKKTAEKKITSTTDTTTPPPKPHCELFLADLPPALRSLQSLAGFFHPYGEISNIQYIPAGKTFPTDITDRDLIEPAKFAKTNCAIIEFLTARVAKFVVGVLRKRIEALNFRIGLLKPGLAEEMVAQEQRLLDSLHLPTFQINKTQSSFLEQSTSQYSSEELSEIESRPTKVSSIKWCPPGVTVQCHCYVILTSC